MSFFKKLNPKRIFNKVKGKVKKANPVDKVEDKFKEFENKIIGKVEAKIKDAVGGIERKVEVQVLDKVEKQLIKPVKNELVDLKNEVGNEVKKAFQLAVDAVKKGVPSEIKRLIVLGIPKRINITIGALWFGFDVNTKERVRAISTFINNLPTNKEGFINAMKLFKPDEMGIVFAVEIPVITIGLSADISWDTDQFIGIAQVAIK